MIAATKRLALLVLATSASWVTALASVESGSKLSLSLHRLSERLALPGYAAAVVQNGKFLFHQSEGYADVAKRIPMKEDTPVGIASVTKTFTGVILRQLANERRISFEDSLFKYPINYAYSPFV